MRSPRYGKVLIVGFVSPKRHLSDLPLICASLGGLSIALALEDYDLSIGCAAVQAPNG